MPVAEHVDPRAIRLGRHDLGDTVAVEVPRGQFHAPAISGSERPKAEVGKFTERGRGAGGHGLKHPDLVQAARARRREDLVAGHAVDVGHRHANTPAKRLLEGENLRSHLARLGVHEPHVRHARGTDVAPDRHETRQHLPRLERLEPEVIARRGTTTASRHGAPG